MKLAAAMLTLTLSTGALAQRAPGQGYMITPGHLDARLTGSSTMLLLYVGVGVVGDYALLPLGPMTLTVGGEVSYDACFLGCLAASLLLDAKVSDSTVTPAARAAIHFPVGGITSEPVDIYILAVAGFQVAMHSAAAHDGSYAWNAMAVGPSVGGGVGGSWFWGDRFFTGTEITVRYTGYTYTPTFTSGGAVLSAAEVTGGGSQLLATVFLGFRF